MSTTLRSGALDSALQMNGLDVLPFNAGGTPNHIVSISAVANTPANGVTVTINPQPFKFRSTTLNDGSIVTRILNTPATLTIPQGATLGAVNGVAARILVLAIDNAGTVECAVVNMAGGNNLDETGLISTTAISASSTAANVVYSTTARTNVAYKVVGFFDSTQATAGTYVTALSTVQGQGGNALSAMGSIGYGQTWQNVTGSRAISTTYYNTTGRPIMVHVRVTGIGDVSLVDATSGAGMASCHGDQNTYGGVSAIVPPGHGYYMSGGTLNVWYELR